MNEREIKRLTVAALVALLTAGPAWSFGDGESSTGGGDALVNKARALIDNKNYNQAITASAKNADGYNLLGYSQRKLKRFVAAEASYERAPALKPQHRGSLEYLGELYLVTGRSDKAREMLARLEDECFWGCEELDELKMKIKASN